jgi:hypothetical protein
LRNRRQQGLYSSTPGQAETASSVPQDHVGHVADEGPPLTLKAALDEALAENLDLAALRAQVLVTRERQRRSVPWRRRCWDGV